MIVNVLSGHGMKEALNCLHKKANYLASGVECIKNCKDEIVNCRNVWF